MNSLLSYVSRTVLIIYTILESTEETVTQIISYSVVQ